MKSKIELIDRAYSKLRISGITVNPTPGDVNIALDEMECMLAEWDLVNVCLGYQFEDEPDPNTESGLVRGYENAVQVNLAIRLAPEFGKPSGELVSHASQSYSKISSAVAKVKEVPYPQRQPVGEANTLRFNRWRRFYSIDNTSPNDCETEIMAKGDIVDGQVNYLDYLVDGDTIESYVMVPSGGLTIDYSEANDDTITFRVTGDAVGTQKIKVTIKTVNGLEKNTCLWYSVVTCKD